MVLVLVAFIPRGQRGQQGRQEGKPVNPTCGRRLPAGWDHTPCPLLPPLVPPLLLLPMPPLLPAAGPALCGHLG